MTSHLWRLYLLAGGLVVGAHLALPVGLPADVLYLVVGVSAAAAMVLAIRVHRPLRAAPWWFMVAGQVIWTLGDAMWTYYDHVALVDPFPSLADVFYLAAYPLFGVGFALLIRGRRAGQDREGLIDSAIFTVALGLLSWIFLMRPVVMDSSSTLLERMIGLGYPLADVLLLGLLVRLITTVGARTASFVMLGAAGALLLAADTAFALVTLHSAYEGGATDGLWLASYVLWGAAALHPSMRTLSQPSPDSQVVFTKKRLLALTLASMASPGALAAQLVLGMVLDAWAVVIGSVVLFLLVVVRMSGLLTQIQIQAGQLAALARTDGLTGLANRRTADAEVQRRMNLSRASGEPLVAVMIDLDRFKQFNDTFGHQAGDRLLSQAAGAWSSLLPKSAMLARYGGEEFVALCSGLEVDEVSTLVTRLSQATPAGQTFSAGLAAWDGVEDPAALMHRADLALYLAKRNGRNRCEKAPSTGAAVPV